MVVGGKRYFRAMDLNPDHPLLDHVLKNGETVRENPEMLVARVGW